MALPERFFRSGAYADRPTLDVNATGVMYYADDTFQLLRWDGSALDWDDIITNGGVTLTSADLIYLAKAANLSDLVNAATARGNLGVAIGSDVQAYSVNLAAIAGLTSAADKGVQFTGAGAAAVYDLTAAGKALLDDADAAAQRATLGLGTMAAEAAADYLTKAGNLSGLADASAARTNLGLGSAALRGETYFEAALGNPTSDGQVLSSTAAGARSWVPFTSPVGFASGNFVLSGGQVAYTDTGLVFRVSAATYYIQGVQYTSAEQTITLTAADATNPRIDVISLDNTGTVVKITGVAAATPTEPDTDPLTQVELTFVQVPATATSITGITSTPMFTEGVEWTGSTNVGGQVTFASTDNPRTGTKDIETTAMATSTYLRLTSGTTIDLSGYNLLVFFIRNKAAWVSTRNLTLRWFTSAGAAVGVGITFKNAIYGFDSAAVGAYQQVAIPVSAFQVPAGTLVTTFQMICGGSSTTLGFYLDDVSLQSGTAGTATTGITQAFADARYAVLPVGQRGNIADTTGSLAASASTTRDVTITGKSATLLAVTTNYPARVRGYTTSAYRTADVARASTTKVTPNSGCLFDAKCGPAAGTKLPFTPAISVYNDDGTPVTTIYLAVTNLDTVSRAITTTLARVVEEA